MCVLCAKQPLDTGTIDTWIAWPLELQRGASFATDCPNHHNFPASPPIAHSPLHGACPIVTMKLTLLIFSLVACLVSEAVATALTFKLPANEQACFFATTKKTEKIAFYFAVR